jgi:hypothetical protein
MISIERFGIATLMVKGDGYREAGSVILRIGYGYNAESHKSDPLIDLAGVAMDQFAQAAVPGAWLVDVMPFCERSLWLRSPAQS